MENLYIALIALVVLLLVFNFSSEYLSNRPNTKCPRGTRLVRNKCVSNKHRNGEHMQSPICKDYHHWDWKTFSCVATENATGCPADTIWSPFSNACVPTEPMQNCPPGQYSLNGKCMGGKNF